MYSKNNLYKIYIKNVKEKDYSSDIPDVTKKITLENLNVAINACDKWDSFLDIGAGGGHYSAPLIKKFKKGIAIELEKNKELDELEKNNKNYRVYNDKIENINLKERIDFISLIDVFEHIVEPTKLVDQISSIQDIGGIVFIVIPNTFYCGPAAESDIYYKKVKFGHVKHYTDTEMINFFKKEKYYLISNEYVERETTQTTRKIIRYISRRDKRFISSFFYKIIRFIFMPVIKLMLKITESIIYNLEKKSNYKNARSRVYVFKKL